MKPVYWGFTASASPTPAQIQALTTRSHGAYADSYVLDGPASGRYAVVSCPAAAGIDTAFFEGGVFGGFNTISSSLTIDGGPVSYSTLVSAAPRYETGDLTVAARNAI